MILLGSWAVFVDTYFGDPMCNTLNSLFLVPVRIRRGLRSRMPSTLLGAIVECFVAAPDHLSAIKAAVSKLQEDGDLFEDLVGGQVHQLDTAHWEGYLARRYPELADQLPDQPDATQFLKMGGVFLGPFVAWDREV